MSATETLAEIETALATAKQLYDTARRVLETALGRVYSDPKDAADILLTQADEFGADHALKTYELHPHGLGHVRAADAIPWQETGQTISEQVPRLVEAQDQLDALAVRRDGLVEGQEPWIRTIDIQGDHYKLDGKSGVLEREGQSAERVSVLSEPFVAKLTPSERFAQDMGSGKAIPPANPSRERGR